MNYILFLYGLLLPFTNAFALTPTITFNVILLSIIPIVIFFGSYKVNANVTCFVLFFFVFQFVTSIINSNQILIGHFISVLVSTLGMFYLLYISISGSQHRYLINGIYFGYLICCILVIIDFILANYFSVREFLPRPIVQYYDPTFLPSLFRARGPIEESGHTAFYLGLFLPIIYFYLPNKVNKIIFCLFGISFILTFSISGFAFFPFSLFFVSLFMTIKKGNLKPVISLFLIGVILLINGELLLGLINEKLNSLSFIQRYDFFIQSYDLFLESTWYRQLFGLGGGYYKYYNIDPPIGLYLTVLFSFGFFGLFFLLVVVFGSLYYSFFKLNGSASVCYSISLVYGWLFYGGISNYWYPWIWIILAMMFSRGLNDDFNRNSMLQ